MTRTMVCAVLSSLLAVSCGDPKTGPTPAASGSAAASAAPAAGGPNVGDAAPAFDLPGSDGKRHALADHRGKEAVVLAWYPKAFTGGWTAECKSLRESGEALRGYEVAVYAASVDPPDKNAEFARSLELDYPILSDPEKQVSAAYGVLAMGGAYAKRWTFIIDKDGKIRDVMRDVSPKTHGADIAKRLGELGIPARSGAPPAK